MNDQAQRIAIAKACGWTFYKESLDISTRVNRPDGSFAGLISPGCHSPLPDYPNDLNAIHEAEKTLDDVGQRKFSMSLHELTRAGQTFGRGLNYWMVIHTTARQRAEAFLRTIGKWEES